MFIDVRQKARTTGGFDYNHGTMFLAPGEDPGAGGTIPVTPPAAPSAGGWTPPDLTKDAAAKAWFDQQTKTLTEGLVRNRDTILAEKRKAEEDLKAFRDKYASLGDPDAARQAMAKLRDEEEKALVARGDIDGLVNRRLKETTDRLNGTLSAKEKEIEAAKKVAEQRWEMVRKLTVDRELAEAAAKVGVHPTAIPDLVNRARGVFTVGDDGKITCVDSNGVPVLEQNGQPRTPATWVESLKADAPHFFPGSSGANSRGGMTPTGNSDAIRLQPGYTQAEFEAASAAAKQQGKRLELPART